MEQQNINYRTNLLNNFFEDASLVLNDDDFDYFKTKFSKASEAEILELMTIIEDFNKRVRLLRRMFVLKSITQTSKS
jgi:hypothetical protein